MPRRTTLTVIGLIALICLLSLFQWRSAMAGTRTVDGSAADWTGTPSTTIHNDAESGEEWIYTGTTGDRRTDGGMTDDADLTEVRLTVGNDGGTDYLYMLFRLANINAQNEVHIAVGFDTDQDNNDTAQNFLGDDSGLTYSSRPFIRPERQLALHVSGGGSPVIEWFDASTWFGLGNAQIAISTANDVVEARVPLADLNGLTATSDFIMTVATFQNNQVWNNDGDSTDDFGVNDAVDVMGIPGQSGNAFGRDLNDSNVYFGWWIQLRGTGNAPTAVVWDRLYHSSCDQLLSSGCAGGDHPVDENLPNDNNNPSQNEPTFISTYRYGSAIPSRQTDHYAFDDESVDIYAMALQGDVSDGASSPRILYFGSGATEDMDVDYSWTGEWHSQTELTYDIFKGTLPAQPPGDVFYSIIMEDETGERSLCRTTGGSGNTNKVLNLFGQWVGAAGCSFNDYAYSVVDDDTSGPTISNVVFTDNGSNDEVCAAVVDNVTDSGDNDSGIQQVIARYSSTKANVSGGGGTTAVMTLDSGNTYCVAGLNFTPDTYYRVEATNNDNDRTGDRETSQTSVQCEGATCDLSNSGNNDVQWFEVLHDTRNRTAIPSMGNELYRDPFGAITKGTPVDIRLRTAEADLTAASLRVYDTAIGTQTLNMTQVAEIDPTYDWWEATIPASYSNFSSAGGQLFYKFILTDGTDTDWYVDDYSHNNYDHEDRYENGSGQVVDDGEAAQFFGNSFRITVYDPAFTVPAWAQNATIYQIMPDRFRNGDATNDDDWPYTDIYGNPELIHGTWNEAPCDPRTADGGDGAGPCAQNQFSADFFGGDLQGVIDKLDYLEDLGVTAIYLNPVFSSPSNHGYDTTDYYNISPRYGDNALFQTLATQAENRGINLILDGVFNHTGSDSVYFDRYNRWNASGTAVSGNDGSGACEAAASSYAGFYNLLAGPGGPCYDGKTYEAWWGYDSLPLLIDYVPNNIVRDFVFDTDNDGDNGVNSNLGIIQYWYAQGADGWRFDVADEIPHDFWEEFRDQVKDTDNLDGPLYSEVWYEALPWLEGDQLDATMNYRYRKAVLGFLLDSNWTDNDNNGDATMWALSPSEFDYALNSIREDYPEPAWYAMMNLMDSHDTNRALFVIRERSSNLTAALSKMKMMAALQFTYPGAPTIYYGDEVGLGARDYDGYTTWGAGGSGSPSQDDPYNRHTYPWADESGSLPSGLPNNDLLTHYQTLGQARQANAVLRTGDVVTLLTDDANDLYAYARINGTDCALAVFNRSTSVQDVTLNDLPTECQTAFEDILSNNIYFASGSSITIDDLPGSTSAVLLPAATGSLTIQKAADPQDGTDFSFTSDIPGEAGFTLDDANPDDSDGVSSSVTFTPTIGTYVITETLPLNWSLTTADCAGNAGSDSLTDQTLTVELQAGETVLCTFDNDFTPPPGTITVTKTVSGTAPLSDWAFSGDLGGFNIPAAGGSEGFSGLSGDSYAITETVKTDYVASVSCDSGEIGSNSVTVDLEPGEEVTCTFLNEYDPPPPTGTITVTKVVSGTVSGSDWSFSGDLGSFTLPAAGGSDSFDGLSDGAYTITETADPGYTTSVSCNSGENGTNSVTVNLEPGEEVTCTFTNTEIVTPPDSVIYMTATAAGTTGNGITFGKEDILRYGGSDWSRFFDGSTHSLSSAHDINAIYVNAANDLYISFFQNNVNVTGLGPVKGQDILRFNGSSLSFYFDGSDVELTTTSEKIDALHILDGFLSPIGSGCDAYLLVSTLGSGKVSAFGGGVLNFQGEDVLGFCATSTGAATAGFWHMVLDGSAQGMPKNSTDSISASDDGEVLYLTTQGTFNVDSANGGHSMVYRYDFGTEQFSGPLFSAPANGLSQKVDGLHVEGDLP